MPSYNATIVGSGPNGLAAAIVLARAGWSVLVREGADSIGGGVRSDRLTLPGFVHDVCSAVYPMALSSPFFRTLPLGQHGLRWIDPPLALAHPFDDGSSALLAGSIEVTAQRLGRDGPAYRRLMSPLVSAWEELSADLLAPALHLPRHPWSLARFGAHAIRSARGLAQSRFQGEHARGLFAGLAGHAATPFDWVGSAAIALVLAAAGHAVGWPIVAGGSQALAGALVSYLRSLGGEILTGAPVESLAELESPVVLLDLTPAQVLRIGGAGLPSGDRRSLERYRYGPGIYKLDWALSGPVPWKSPECSRAATVHVGGTLEEIAAAEESPWHNQSPQKPFVLLVQPSLFDPSRAPRGQHTLWAYSRVPHGSSYDMTSLMEAQIERFAPGFRDLILARSAMGPAELERYNPNLVGGDIGGGVNSIMRLLFGPQLRRVPYATPKPGLYLCSSSTPPGGGVHGMCGYHAARAALKAAGVRPPV